MLESWLYGRLPGVSSIPSEWSLTKLTEVARLESGHTPSRHVPSYWNGEIRWLSLHDTSRLEAHTVFETEFTITPAGIANSSARLLPEGTVALSRTATVGKCVLLGREMATTQDFACYVPGPRLCGKYLMHLFRHMQPVWRALAGGSTHQTVYMPVFENLQTLLPPLPEQRKIAEVLDTLDETIRKTEQIIAKLKQVKQGLLHDLLTRGIDHNGELRDPERHPEQFKDSELGRIPKEWEVVNLGEASERITDGTHQAVRTVSLGPNTVPFLYVSCIRDGRIDWSGASFVSRSQYADIGRGREPTAGMVLYTAVGSFGHAAVVDAPEPFAFQRHIACIYPTAGLRGAYLASYLNSDRGRQYAERVALGNAQRTITLGELAHFPIALPSTDEQESLIEVLRRAEERLSMDMAALEKLRLLKQGVMEDLLTGKVRVTPLLEASDTHP